MHVLSDGEQDGGSAAQRGAVAAYFARLFRGRSDVRGVSPLGGKPYTTRASVTTEVYAAHLRGDTDLGVVPVLEDGTCWWAGADLDGDKFSSPAACRDAAFRLLAVLRRWDLAPQLFTSRRRGFHVLVFFTAPLLAWAVRAILAAALDEAGLPATTERFPKQDHPSTTPAGLGNWLRCPYFGKAEPGRRVALGDDGSLLTLPEWLDRVELVPADRVPALAASLGVDLGESAAPRAAVGCGPSASAKATPATARAPRPLSPVMAHLLRHGGPTNPKPDRSRWVLSLALGFVNAGRTFDEFFDAVRDSRNGGGAKIQEIALRRGLKAASDYAEGRWRKAEARVALNPPFGSRRDAECALLEIERAAATRPWGGRTGGTNRAVFAAHLIIAWRTGRLVHDAAVRDVADLAGVARSTANRAEHRLACAGWLRRLRPAGAKHATTWRLKVPSVSRGEDEPKWDTQTCYSSTREVCVPPGPPLADPASDVWRSRQGLSKALWQTWI